MTNSEVICRKRPDLKMIAIVKSLMRFYGFKTRDVSWPLLVYQGDDDLVSYHEGYIDLGYLSTEEDLVHELVHHYQADQSPPAYRSLSDHQRLIAWTKDHREYEARFIALVYTRPDLTVEEIRLLIDQENKAICNGDLSVVKTDHQ